MIHRSDPRWLRDDFDILCTTGYFRLWCSFLIYCIVLYPPTPSTPLTGFPFYSVPLVPFSLLCAWGSHSLLCHWVSLCFKTHNPVRSWHSNVLLMPVKVIQPVGQYTIWATAVLWRVYTSTWCSMYWTKARWVHYPDPFTVTDSPVCMRARAQMIYPVWSVSSRTRTLSSLSDGLC